MNKTTNNTLVLVEVDGTTTEIENSYGGIKDAIKGRPFDFVTNGERFGCYIDDEGMLLELPLNVPASIMAQRPLYGPAVCCRGEADDEGETLPMDDTIRSILMGTALAWYHVVLNSEVVGQDPYAYADESTIPPPTIQTFDNDDDFFKAIFGQDAPIPVEDD